MGRITNVVWAAILAGYGAVLAYFRILMTVSLIAAVAMVIIAAAGYPLDPMTFITIGLPGVGYYALQFIRGYRSAGRSAEPAAK